MTESVCVCKSSFAYTCVHLRTFEHICIHLHTYCIHLHTFAHNFHTCCAHVAHILRTGCAHVTHVLHTFSSGRRRLHQTSDSEACQCAGLRVCMTVSMSVCLCQCLVCIVLQKISRPQHKARPTFLPQRRRIPLPLSLDLRFTTKPRSDISPWASDAKPSHGATSMRRVIFDRHTK